MPLASRPLLRTRCASECMRFYRCFSCSSASIHVTVRIELIKGNIDYAVYAAQYACDQRGVSLLDRIANVELHVSFALKVRQFQNLSIPSAEPFHVLADCLLIDTCHVCTGQLQLCSSTWEQSTAPPSQPPTTSPTSWLDSRDRARALTTGLKL